MDSFNQMISFWGGVASLVALLITVVGGFLILLKNAKKRYIKELDNLAAMRRSIADRAKAATTQGKRMDLFIYHQSHLSARRFSELVEEVQVCAIHICSFILITFSASIDANADYFVDRAFGKGKFFYNNFGALFVGMCILLLLMNIALRRQKTKNKKVLEALSRGLTDELENIEDDKMQTG